MPLILSQLSKGICCVDVDLILKDPDQLEPLNNKAMDVVHEEHMITFHKQLHVCDPSLGLKFMHEVQIHYNMNPKLKMFIEKLQMLILACVCTNHKCFWFRQWNQSWIVKEAQKFPEQGFPDATFDKWLHISTFWH